MCHACSTLCDPYLNLFRGLIPPIGGTLDLSPILAFIVLDVRPFFVDFISLDVTFLLSPSYSDALLLLNTLWRPLCQSKRFAHF